MASNNFSPVDIPFQPGDEGNSIPLPHPIPPYTSPLSLCEDPGSNLNPLWGGRTSNSSSNISRYEGAPEFDPMTLYGMQPIFQRQTSAFAQTSSPSIPAPDETLMTSNTDHSQLFLPNDSLVQMMHKSPVNGTFFHSCDDFFSDPQYELYTGTYTKGIPSTLTDSQLLPSLCSDMNGSTGSVSDSESDEEPVADGGYDYNFVCQKEIENDDLFCPICKLVSRDPHQSGCCGKIFCKVCIKKLKMSQREPACPSCRKEKVLLFPDKRSSRSIASLRVYCKRKKKGCLWEGTVQDTEAHIKNCDYQRIPCLNGCGKRLRRLRMDGHIKSACPIRLFKCPDCKELGQWTFITGEHQDKCLAKMVRCENEGCGIRLSRNDFEDHQLNCPKQVVDCSYRYLGCKTRCKREDLEKHENQQVNSHLESAAKLASVFVTPPKDHLLQIAPVVVRLFNISQSKELWSLPFLTAAKGYKMSLLVSRRTNDEVIFEFCLMQGLYDTSQSWPFSGKVTVLLLNQKEDRNHYEVSTSLFGDTSLSRVVSRSGEEYGQKVLIGSFKHSKTQEVFSTNNWQTSLENSGYVVDDMMSVRVSYEPVREKAQSVLAGRKRAKLSQRHH